MSDPATPSDSVLDVALAYAAAGIRVLPIKPGHKRPPMSSWQHAATIEPKTIRNWFNGLYRDHGIGLAMGLQPDGRHLFAVDLDEHNPEASGHDIWSDLQNTHGYAPDTPRAVTGANGGHLLFSAPFPVSNGAAGAIGPGVDIRGEGGQIVVAPSIHPNGNPYGWEDGFAPWEIEVADAPAWLLELVRPRAEAPPTEPVAFSGTSQPDPRREQVGTYNDSPADVLRASWDWPAELEARGWTLARHGRDGDHYTRPGKDPREGTSGVLHGADGPFVVFTTDASTVDLWRAGKPGNGCVSLSPLAFVAAYDHQGDLSAATRALRASTPQMDLSTLIAAETGAEEAMEATADDEWTPSDIVAIARQIANGTRARETPTLLHVSDAIPLLYRGRVHSIFGAPGGGKTWIALCALAERLIAGEPVLFIDWEDSIDGTAARLLDLGVTIEQLAHLDYISPSTALSLGIGKLFELADARAWTLVVIDSAGEAMAAAGIDPNADGQVATWMALAKSLTTVRSSPAVLMLDHVPKNGETPATFAIGSQRKLAAISGASYRCDTLIEPAIGKAGKLKLVVAKDRLGNRPKGSTAAEVHFEPGDDTAVTITLRKSEAQAAAERGEKFRPTVYMERVSRWLELNPGAGVNEIRDGVEGKRDFVTSALATLIEEGWITTEDGPRRARLHTVAKPFREDLDALAPVDNSDRGTAPHRAPTAPRDQSHDRGTAPHPLQGGAVTGRSQHLEPNPPVDNPFPERMPLV